MQTYKISWVPRSPTTTPLQSDTIFGHLCWAIKYLWGEEELEKLISALKDSPIFVLSSAFPQGKLPKPAFPISGIVMDAGRATLIDSYEISDIRLTTLLKQIKKDVYVSLEYLKKKSFVFDALEYLENEIKIKSGKTETVKHEAEQIEFHNKIDRQTGTTSGSGELFASPLTFYHDVSFDSWLDTDYYSYDQLQELFQFISLNGFGKDKNTGKGKYEISIEPYKWDECKDYNAYLNLSNMVPAKDDNARCSYSSKTKFGKVGGDFAVTETPFKYPVLVIEPGAVFSAIEVKASPRGQLLCDIHPNPKIVQNLYSYSLPIKLKGVQHDT